MIKIGILASTQGTDMQALIDAQLNDSLDAEIAVVISNKHSFALERAEKYDIPARFISAKNKEREEYDKEAAAVLDHYQVDLVLLIGYMRIISPWFVRKYEGKIMNIHPSLLPDFAGGMDMDVHSEVLRSGVKKTGCTLHFVTENVDEGPIIMQQEVAIDEDETAETLKKKVQQAEQEVLVKAVQLYSKGKIKLIDNKVEIAA